jgi:cystathionine beta-lyase/cystathionine gamma-synthase
LTGTGSAIAGVVIGRNEDMFIPKGQSAAGRSWEQTLFWNVYYVKGAFLNADASFEVLQGIRTLDVRMLQKCINTLILARFLSSHPDIRVRCCGLESDPNHKLCQKLMYLALPAPLFTIDPDLHRNADAAAPDVPALLRQPGSDLRPHDQPRAIQHDRELSWPDDPFGVG